MPAERAGLGPARRCASLLAVLAVLTGGCAPGAGDDGGVPDALAERGDLTPTFPVAPTTTTSPATAPGEAPTGAAGEPTATAAPVADPAAPVDAGPAPAASRINDPAGDATVGAVPAPPWAELLGATLTRLPSFLELRVDLGAPAPTSSGAADRTMNVAAFVDVDGDGQVDFELWANLADGGWDVAWFDNRQGTGAYSDDAAMDVLVDGAALVVRFPSEYVGGAESFRWSLASEYGTYPTLGTPASTRDDAPDSGTAATFPA